ncbi:hypothetical protein BC835DRAFT_1413451 [Cytidiella melzeri]|nr:hypothetical protein BC835DRAFT_1413451 [Cytidiella melzeri]
MSDAFPPNLIPELMGDLNGLGSTLIGSWFTVILCGVAMAQTYSYFNEYSDDDIWTKASVWFVTLVNILHSIFVCIATYHYSIMSIGVLSITGLLTVHWSIQALLVTRLVMAGFVLMYFTKICFHLLADKKIQTPVVVVIVIMIILHLGFGIALIVKISALTTFYDLNSIRSAAIIPMTATQVAADALVSVTLCLPLPKHSAVFKQTKNVLYTVVICAVSRGIVTSAAAMVELLAISVAPHALWFSCAELLIAGCYANSLLSALTTRNRIRRLVAGNMAMQTMSIPLRSYLPSASMSNDDRETVASDIPKPTPTHTDTKADILSFQACDDALESQCFPHSSTQYVPTCLSYRV